MRLIAIIFGCLFMIAPPAFAQEGQKLSIGAIQAAKEFNGLLAKAAEANQRPVLTAPPAAPLFAKIFDVRSLASLPPPTVADLSWESEWLGASANSYMALLNLGTDPKAPDYQQAIESNVQLYEDEISQAMNFMLRLMPRMVASAHGFMQTLSEAERNSPARQNGLKSVRDGYMQTVSGATSFVGGGPKPANAKLVSGALRDTVGQWRTLASAEERTQLLNILSQARQNLKDGDTNDNLIEVSSALAATK